MTSFNERTTKMKYVPIMPDEEYLLSLRAPPVATVTWFEGDRIEAVKLIESRMKDIIRFNPWLQGSLVKKDGHIVIAYPPLDVSTESPNGSMLLHLEKPDPIVGFGIPLKDPSKTKDKLVLEQKKDMQQPLWKVSIIPCAKSPESRFAVFVSMSHILGDGQNFYQLYNMLLCGEPIRPLTLMRVPESFNQRVATMGYDGACGMTSLKIMLMIIVGLIAKFLFRKSIEVRTFLIDPEKMKDLKESQKSDCSFISSNDIITSWFFSQTKSLCSKIIVNMRSRLDGHSEDLVGNYLTSLYFEPGDFSSPSDVRKHVNSMDNPPVSWRLVINQASVVTNWASYAAEHTALDGCQELFHQPMLDLVATGVPNLRLLVVFRARPGQLGCLMVGTPDCVAMTAPFEESSL